jgi:hypothetical protein
MSNGTFNLTELYRQLGIKNPEPGVRETVQPVLIVGDLSGLTPLHVPPTGLYGGAIISVGGEYSKIQVTSRAPGGSEIRAYLNGTFLKMAIAGPSAGLVAHPDWGPLSNSACTALVEAGTDAAQTIVGQAPYFKNVQMQVWPGGGGLFIPTGKTLLLETHTVAINVPQWSMIVRDIPAAEIPPE